MDDKPPRSEANRGFAALSAIAIGIITSLLFKVSVSVIEQAPMSFTPGLPAFIFQVVLVAVPFLLLAFLDVRNWIPWFVGIAFTAVLWTYAVYDFSLRRAEGSGANIGMGLILLGSPILISAACLFAARRELRR